MTLIDRQSALVDGLENVFKQRIKQGYFGGHLVARRSKLKRLHCEEMVSAGYSKTEARESSEQCEHMAWLNASCESVEASLGVGA